MRHVWKLFFLGVALTCLLVGCGTITPSQQPTSLQVTRVSIHNEPPRSWTITDVNSVQQLFQEIQNLPQHQNNGADSCAEPFYRYHLNFLIGTKSIQKDDLYTYCSTLTLQDGSQRDPSATFNSLFMKMLLVNNLSGFPNS